MKPKKAKSNKVLAPYVARLNFAKYHRGSIADAIVAAYQDVSFASFLPRPPKFPNTTILSNTPQCLGDFVMLTDLPRAAKSQGQIRYTWSPRIDGEALFRTFVPEWEFPQDRLWFTDGQHFLYRFNCGNGHLLQKWQRTFGLKVSTIPCGRLVVEGGARFKDRVILHFCAGEDHRRRQKEEFHFHPRPRELYPASKTVLEQFIKNNPQLEFVEVGHKSMEIRGASWKPTATTSDLIRLISTGSWFFGLLSGPLHVATALGLRCIGLINFPYARQVVLPVLKTTGVPEEEWLYPQHVWLHQDNGSSLVPLFSINSLTAAFAGDVYPFWSHDWLDLIHEEKYTL